MLGYGRFHTAGSQYHPGSEEVKEGENSQGAQGEEEPSDGKEAGAGDSVWGTPSSQIYK